MINHKVNPSRRVGIILNLFIAFNLIFVATGCGGTVKQPPPSSLELHTLWATGSEANSLHTLTDRYRAEHPDVSVNVVTYSSSSARDILKTGNLSGLYQWPMGRDLINFWTSSWDSESLDSLYSQTGLNGALPQGMLSILRHNFHPLSIPVNVHRTNVLWYNKSIIESNGIDPTTLETFEGWEAAAQTLKRSGVTPLALYDNSRQSVLELFEVILAGTLGADGYRGLWSGTTSWTAPEVGISLQRLQMMLQYTNRAQTLETGPQQVLDGKAAMTIANDQVYSQFAGSMEAARSLWQALSATWTGRLGMISYDSTNMGIWIKLSTRQVQTEIFMSWWCRRSGKSW